MVPAMCLVVYVYIIFNPHKHIAKYYYPHFKKRKLSIKRFKDLPRNTKLEEVE